MALRAIWQFMDQSVTHKIVYGSQLRFGPYNILWVTSRSINYHMALSAMNLLLNRKNINQRKPQNGNWKKKPNIANHKRQFGIKAANF